VATSRTSTAKWKNIAARRRRTAQSEGITACPGCRRQLDYDTKRTKVYNPNLVQVDHIIPAEQGGEDTFENSAILCADCNLKKGGRARAPVVVPTVDAFPVSRQW